MTAEEAPTVKLQKILVDILSQENGSLDKRTNYARTHKN